MSVSRVQMIQERCEKARGAPWTCEVRGDGVYINAGSFGVTFAHYAEGAGAADGDFIAHSREDVPWLLGELERLREAAARACDEMAKHRSDVWCGDYDSALDALRAALDGASE